MLLYALICFILTYFLACDEAPLICTQIYSLSHVKTLEKGNTIMMLTICFCPLTFPREVADES